MPDIRCWNCEGAGKFVRVNGVNDAEAACFLCNGTGTIPDRRRATPNDRAVERILAEDEAQGSGRYVDRYTQGYGDGVERCAEIIREEAERHE